MKYFSNPKKTKTMKIIYKAFWILAFTASFTVFSSFNSAKINKTADAYIITIVSTEMTGTNQVWTWSVTNPNPGNGSNGTLQDISHWSLPLCPLAEAALVSAQYSYDGTNWSNISINMDRDPSIRACTSTDVLKFNVGTSSTAPLYCRITFNKKLTGNPIAVSYIKTGGGLQGCNLYIYSGVGCDEDPTAPSPANN
jgi:hypothetical protein